ncbi:MAG: hypothetical protein EOO99_11650 [Pedobacter sp.]|nr:MAG: hypothetical protein EOO99_11650 [Pedobacter sp.]
MGTINNGVNGGFSGKAGSVIGSSWNGIDYIKGLYKKRNKPATEDQLIQQARFKLAISFLRPIAKLLYFTFKAFSKSKKSGVNVALQHLLLKAIKGVYPNFEIDLPKVMISDGALAEAACVATAIEGFQIQLAWDNDTNSYNADGTDQVNVLMYDPERNFFKTFSDVATRLEGEKTIRLTPSMVGKTVHLYVFLKSRNNKYSPSYYAGEVVILA